MRFRPPARNAPHWPPLSPEPASQAPHAACGGQMSLHQGRQLTARLCGRGVSLLRRDLGPLIWDQPPASSESGLELKGGICVSQGRPPLRERCACQEHHSVAATSGRGTAAVCEGTSQAFSLIL